MRLVTREGPFENGVEGSSVDMYKDGDESIFATVDSVEVDPQTELVAGRTGVEARTVNGGAAE